MKVWSPVNIHANTQVDRSMHENLGEGSNEPPLRLYVWLKGLRLEGLNVILKTKALSIYIDADL